MERQTRTSDDAMKIPNKPPPAQGSAAERRDLLGVIRQYKNPRVPEELQEACDKSMLSIFETYLKGKDLPYDENFHKKVHHELGDVIIPLKKYYNRPRPGETAIRYGIDSLGDDLKSAESPSYPSGHAIQSFVHAVLLGRKFPQHAEDFLSIAEMISQSRIDRGVHFPSDIDFGRQVAYLISRELLDGHS